RPFSVTISPESASSRPIGPDGRPIRGTATAASPRRASSPRDPVVRPSGGSRRPPDDAPRAHERPAGGFGAIRLDPRARRPHWIVPSWIPLATPRDPLENPEGWR